MRSCDFDAVVVGAGVVGLAIGWALARRGLDVVLLEKEGGIGQGVSSRNSEVVHGGLYYPTGSIRARLCVEGRRRLYDFARSHGVRHEKCGKLIVATDAAEVRRLDALESKARENDVEGMSRLTGAQARALEPEVTALEALMSAETGIIDTHGLMLALQGEITAQGGAVALRTSFQSAEPADGGGFVVTTGGGDPARLTTGRLVISAGLGAQAAAAAVDGYPAEAIPRLWFGKGVYFRPQGRAPFTRLVYPLPVPGALGIHFTRDLGGQGRFGPDLAFVDDESYDVDPARGDAFYAAIRRYWPGLRDGILEPDYAGLRPKIHGPHEPQPDFRIDGPEIHGLPGIVALFGIESPGLTSSLAIGDAVAARLGL